MIPQPTISPSAPTPSSPAELRAQPRTPDAAVAFIQPLHPPGSGACRVDLIDHHSKGIGVRAAIPLSRGTPVVVSIAHHPPMQGLFLCRVAHCTNLGNGRYHLGMTLLDQRPGNLNTTRIPDSWRQR